MIDVSSICPTPSSSPGNNNQPALSCNPNDPNPPASCNNPVQPDSTGAYPNGTVVSGTGVHCPAGTISKHGFCQTQAQQDKNIAISKQRGCDFIGGVSSLLPLPLGKAVNGLNNKLNGCSRRAIIK